MIRNIKLKSIALNGEKQEISFNPGHVTVFVGPNNGGKSLLLKEIENWCLKGPLSESKILSHLEIEFPPAEKLIDEIKKFELQPTSKENIPSDHVKYGKVNIDSNSGSIHTYSISDLKAWINGSDHRSFQCFVFLHVLKLDALTRLNLVNQKPTQDLQNPPNNILDVLFRNDSKIKILREIIKDSFGKFYVIDPTAITKLRIRLANREPQQDEEKTLSQATVDYYRSQPLIDEFSDGVKAFTGILMAIISSPSKILLIDEPEAFLHPTLVSKLGYKASTTMHDREGNLLVASHSPRFLMGCIESGKQVNIVRLTYDETKGSSARILSNEKVKVLMQNPLLRSVGIMEALFYKCVIITEADADRAFYQEINQRLNIFKPEWSIQDCLFLNAHGKQEIWDILKPLRELGIPTAVIVDIDVIKNGGKEWEKALDAGL